MPVCVLGMFYMCKYTQSYLQVYWNLKKVQKTRAANIIDLTCYGKLLANSISIPKKSWQQIRTFMFYRTEAQGH